MLDDTFKMPVLVTPFGEVHAEIAFRIFEGVGCEKNNIGIPFKVVVSATLPKLRRSCRTNFGTRRHALTCLNRLNHILSVRTRIYAFIGKTLRLSTGTFTCAVDEIHKRKNRNKLTPFPISLLTAAVPPCGVCLH